MNTHPANRPAADRATSDPAPLVPTATTANPPPTGPDPVTAREIADFLRDLAELRNGARGDDAERAAFLARKAELLARIAADPAPTPTMAPEGRTP